jgi:YHS domain-containing protein
MVRTIALASAFSLALATGAFAVSGEFDNMCAMGLTGDKEVKTDCSVNASYEGKTYCFGNQEAKDAFMKDPAGNVAKAEEYYSKHKG